jgi:aspartyl-tRNA(Asn)/glutamyl-tRNA(Gln) amidotransferase subunit A
MLENFIPPYQSTVVTNLKNKGVISLGKTNMDEFAMGSSNVTSYFGSVINPWSNNCNEKDLVPGGSSGGSAVSVSAFMAMASLGTDTGGSVRQPASFNGVVGIKPTYGRASRWGIVPFASSLDQAGVLARSVEDVALVLSSMIGFDPMDSTSADISEEDLSSDIGKSVKNLRIGVPEHLMTSVSDEMMRVWQNSIDIFKSGGATIHKITIPYFEQALPVYYVIACSEASSNLAMYDGVRYGHRSDSYDSFENMILSTRSEGFGPEVQRRILIGTYFLSSGFIDQYYVKAQNIRNLICKGFDQIFEDVDVVLLPSAPTSAFSVDQITDNPVDMYKNDIFTVVANLAKLPAISVPAGFSAKGLPFGMQLMGKMYDEKTVLRAASMMEKNINMKFEPKGY